MFEHSTWTVPGPKCIIRYIHIYGNCAPAVRPCSPIRGGGSIFTHHSIACLAVEGQR